MNNFPTDLNENNVFQQTKTYLTDLGFHIVDEDLSRPWGGFLVVDETQSSQFIQRFFPGVSLNEFEGFSKLSPKFLIVAPQARLSWQYHHRRSEIWRVIHGNVKVVISETDDETMPQLYAEGELIRLKQGERHRLIGTDGYGIVAEIWQHTDPANPSDESDIIRVQDDFGR